jgi:hypothetical protein
MGDWILIIVIGLSAGGSSIHHIPDFGTKSLCMQAGEALSKSAGKKIETFVCVPTRVGAS